MRKAIYALPALVLLVLFGWVGDGLAQQMNVLKAKIPFSFVAGDTTLPAGTYLIDTSPEGANVDVIALQTTEKQGDELVFKKVYTSTEPVSADDKTPHLVFRKVGHLHFLEEVVPPVGTAEEVR